jgi:hypothetical protein
MSMQFPNVKPIQFPQPSFVPHSSTNYEYDGRGVKGSSSFGGVYTNATNTTQAGGIASHNGYLFNNNSVLGASAGVRQSVTGNLDNGTHVYGSVTADTKNGVTNAGIGICKKF